jgi:hypothetical protein
LKKAGKLRQGLMANGPGDGFDWKVALTKQVLCMAEAHMVDLFTNATRMRGLETALQGALGHAKVLGDDCSINSLAAFFANVADGFDDEGISYERSVSRAT